ncbi:MAG: 1-(5-phosphoribosyl)-5-((5-phosphoribosylamino)methylideneamino)imidazole-4-carboxamide isomerase [Gammaproteobacteria bacterium]|nr:MAG: 1-(5-phosphoribosyl)-5-((5-phosphoribosylamino)methylideneamino)imidazole-4-carboxamide isomerase [Gammaproteobacteria bacterium]
MDNTPPTAIKLHTQSNMLELVYGEQHFHLSFEFLRVHSPSAEVKGHGKPILQVGKRQVKIRNIETVGNYALKITYDDGHDTGLYSWQYLNELCANQGTLWQAYLDQLAETGGSREPLIIGKWQ